MFIETTKTDGEQAVIASPAGTSGYVLRISLTAALAGFIFGFDTVVISGANLPIKELWHTSPWFHGFFIMSMALWGTVIGAIFGGMPTEKFGRKKVLIWIGVLFSLSAIGTAFAPEPYSFSFFSLSRWFRYWCIVGGGTNLHFGNLHTCQPGQIGGALPV